MYTPVNPSFTIKVGCKGVFITRTSFRDSNQGIVSFRILLHVSELNTNHRAKHKRREVAYLMIFDDN